MKNILIIITTSLLWTWLNAQVDNGVKQSVDLRPVPKVGIPFVKTGNTVKHLGVGLSNDGKIFYTYANNTLIHWNMNPVKMLDSVKITDPLFRSPLNFDITPDGKKIIFSHSRRGLGLFDLESKQFIKKIAMRFASDALVGSNIITVDKDRKISVRSLENLDLIKTIQIPKKNLHCDECHDMALTLLKSKNEKILALVTGIRLIAFDSVTLKKIKEEEAWFSGGQLYGSIDHKTVSGSNINLTRYVTFDLNTLNRTLMTKTTYRYRHRYKSRSLRRWYTSRAYNQYDHSSVNVLFRFKSKKLYQFMDGNWLTMTNTGYFDGSDNARQYLYIKTELGQSIPIDDSTYEKYHIQINLEDE